MGIVYQQEKTITIKSKYDFSFFVKLLHTYTYFAMSLMYWSPFTHSSTSNPSLSSTLAWAAPLTTRMESPVVEYWRALMGWFSHGWRVRKDRIDESIPG